MMQTELTNGSSPAPSQAGFGTWSLSNTKGAAIINNGLRFSGDGVRYKAKLIGVDPVPDGQGDKMCWDSMMKLKGFEQAARRQGKHKLRVWLNVSSNGLKITDERTGIILYDHDRSRISSLKRDDSDPRALAYVYQQQDAYLLFYIKTANLAEPVLSDIQEVCKAVDQQTPEEPAQEPTQTNSLLLLNHSSTSPAERSALEDVFSPQPPLDHSNQVSPSNELMDVFSVQTPAENLPVSQPESPKPTLSNSQILSIFPTHPVGGSQYAAPPYSAGAMAWGQQQGLLGNQWAGPAVAPWPTVPAWGSACRPMEAQAPQPGVTSGGGDIPAGVNGYSSPFNSTCSPPAPAAPLQSAPPTLNQNLFL